MNRAQKLARFNLKIVAVGVPLTLLTIAVSWVADQVAIILVGFGILWATGLITILSPLFVKQELGKISFDERDSIIEKKAYTTGYCTLWCIFIAGCTIPCFVLSSIPTVALPVVLAVALVTVRLVESMAILAQYGWAVRGEKS